jgi:hypothetical protein
MIAPPATVKKGNGAVLPLLSPAPPCALKILTLKFHE